MSVKLAALAFVPEKPMAVAEIYAFCYGVHATIVGDVSFGEQELWLGVAVVERVVVEKLSP